jgi:Galactose oxidase, central domain/Kelch motif
MTTPRVGFTATLLADGKVLVAGGVNGFTNSQANVVLASAELFDPATGSWTATGSMGTPRTGQTATLLPDGKVLLAGGSATQPIGVDASPSISSAELYDPATGTWTTTGAMTTPRTGQTATLLRDGKVLVAGGGGPGRNGDYHLPTLASAELYDPATGTWTATGQLVTSRSGHSAALLADGRVLVSGGSTSIDNPDGSGGGYDLLSAELYDPGSGSWTATGTATSPTGGLTTVPLPDGRVLHAGVPAELYDPSSGSWIATGNMLTPRAGEGVTLLADGKVLVEGGGGGGDAEITSAELYDPGTGSWTATANLSQGRQLHNATLLRDGRVLVAGGVGGGGPLASAELYDPGNPGMNAGPSPTVGPARAPSWSVTGSMGTPRSGHTATPLADGKVLVAGGQPVVPAELYDPSTGAWTATGSMVTPRAASFTATPLPNGRVLVAGGWATADGPIVASAELYDPGTGSWTATGSMATPRGGQTATLLPNGTVLVAGGYTSKPSGQLAVDSAELYDPATGIWTAAGSMGTPRAHHTATLLPDGKVLVVGGAGSALAPAELYDPSSRSWTDTGSMVTPRVASFTATLLRDGRVLVAGGGFDPIENPGPLGAAELYDPSTGAWTATGKMVTPTLAGTATLLLDGGVLVAGGDNVQTSAQLYDPSTGSWTATVSLGTPRMGHTATLLADGRVLVAGGSDWDKEPSAVLYDPGSGG